MRFSWLSFFALATYGTQVLAVSDAPCTRTVTAKAGDTCASLGAAYSLTVSDFLRANPGLSVCALVAGSTYCVAADGSTATAPPAPPTPSSRPPTASTTTIQPIGSLAPSPDGSDGICGGQYTCLGSVYGDCCSLNGYCGNTTDYCGEGCNPIYGRCGGGTDPACEPATTATVTIGGVVTVTVGGAATTATVTKIQTSIQIQTQTVTKTVTASAAATPTPVFPGSNKSCTKWYLVKTTDRCQVIARTYGITTTQITSWNPGFDCYDVEDMAGYYICVGI